ncbi:transcriptional regulator NrdR [Mergibacter septicus]|uniref:Transcriptional repressor NrdR n=1 Tax=Mergibacter septicus TaxID=221402 RepID=A0A8E3MGU9_9PAST|nr:transcriptional regulator NrdR [Mergibacter septicus]AWX15670.1 transcriptional regulator NrdR [Mergibacter septicus]QDJ13147.1 transcriptional regulator NrdR [Mergibacter septicus]QDJ14923.1 transcriptional regulator NrdR [Mergibacter septicus]UTU47651.1 transcriptional regulator NrdR [Mergibacter septicus]WMR96744.1 transcriptional regulator NrdR [Mergibacter septicus]
MYCPFCSSIETKVIDSRLIPENNQVRRRRECLECKERFTTFEIVELTIPKIIKNNGNRELFDEQKLRLGLHRALEKRPVSAEAVESAIRRIIHRLQTTGEREVSSKEIGNLVMHELKTLDKVAYIRFASVYLSFDNIAQFSTEIEKLQEKEES